MVTEMPAEVQDSLGKRTVFPDRLDIPGEFAALALQMIENQMLNGTIIRLDGAVRMEAIRVKIAAVERIYLDELMHSRDAVEGLEAFIAKRPAKWEHR